MRPFLGSLVVFILGVPAAADEAPPLSAELQPFKSSLMTALRAGLAEGPVAAIDACRVEAPAIAASVQTETLRMGRTSHRLRNPANAAPAWVAPVLAGYLAEPDAATPQTVMLEDGAVGYVEPIRLMPLCVTCHGRELAPELARRIEALYPDDQATGFAVGELRGVFWLEQR